MKIYLFRSEEISADRFRAITGILKRFNRPIEFIVREEDIAENPDENQGERGGAGPVIKGNTESLEKIPWSIFFKRCEQFRAADRKIKDEDLVVFFTDYGNEEDWFSSWDPSGRKNFFIQTSGWGDFVESEECYPVIYELVTIPLYLSVCDNLDEVKAMAHYDTPRGCPFDYCGDKTQVRLRLRTGDVCRDCRDKMIGKLDKGIALQVFSILDDIRRQMLFRNQFAMTGQLSRLEVNKFHREMRFTDIGNNPVKLHPREITVYLFFINHPEGVGYPYIPDHIEEIRALYRNFSDDANIVKFTNTVEAIALEEDHQTLSEIAANIKRKIILAVGQEIAVNYTINFIPGEPHRIPVDRQLVTVT